MSPFWLVAVCVQVYSSAIAHLWHRLSHVLFLQKMQMQELQKLTKSHLEDCISAA